MVGSASNLRPWVGYVSDIMKQNLEFLVKNYKELLDESIRLLNDVIKMRLLIWPPEHLPQEVRSELLSRYLMYPMIIHVVYPQANFLPVAVLLGALPQAFYTLRTILEALVIALYADSKDDLTDKSWGEKIEHESVRRATVFAVKDSMQKYLIKALGKDEGEKWTKSIMSLYQAISAWVHPVARIKIDGKGYLSAGILKGAIVTLLEKGELPNYSLGIPAEYGDEDLGDLKYLGEAIKDTRRILAIVAYVWADDKEFINRKAIIEFIEKLEKP